MFLHSLPVATSNNTASISKNETIAPNMNVNNLELHESAFNGTLKTFLIPDDDSVDILEFMSKHKEQIQILILANGFHWPQKVQFSLNLNVQKPSVINDEDLNNPTQNELVDIYVSFLMVPILSDGLADGTFFELVDRMQSVLHSFASHGSGWVLQQVVRLFIKVGKMNPIRGSSHITLPIKIAKSSHLINIRNHDDHDCFNLCYTAAYHLHYRLNLIVGRYEDPAAEKTCPATYRTSNAKRPIGEFPTPMSIRNTPEFERLNKVRVNVFLYEKGDLVPMLISKNESEDTFSMDLLLLFEPGKHHFVVIINLLRFICEIKNYKFRTFMRLCRNCFHISYSEEANKMHQRSCKEHEPAVIKMPSAEDGSNKYKFNNYAALSFDTVVIYFDFASFLKPVITCNNNPNTSSSRILEKHEPSGYSLCAIEHGSSKPYFFDLNSSEKCILKFIEQLHILAKQIYQQKNRYPNYIGNRSILKQDEATSCWLCLAEFVEGETKCLDHCHYSGEFLGWAHSKCNLARQRVRYTPVVEHNTQTYDLHHICLALGELEPTSTIQVIPATDEKYISLSIGVLVDTYTRANSVKQIVYEYMRFIDSCKFLNSSLQKLVDNLPADKFSILDEHFKQADESSRALLKRKDIYPYSYMSNRLKFDEQNLPPLRAWGNQC